MEQNKRLAQQIRLIADIVEANPCKMKPSSFSALSSAVDVFTHRPAMLALTIEEVSIWLGVSTKSIQRWQSSKGFPKTKLKGKTGHLVSSLSVQRWCEQNSTKPK